MTIPVQLPHRRYLAGILALVLTVAGVAIVGTAPAQSQTSACTAGVPFNFGNEAINVQDQVITSFVLPGSGWVTSRTYPVSLGAGTYDLTARSYDGYDDRSLTPAQPSESWKAEFLAADGSVLATSAATADLADGVEEASWSGSIGTVTLAAPATSVRIVHAAVGDSSSANSVNPVCIAAQIVCPSGQSVVNGACVAPTTTTAAPTTTTAAPSTTPSTVPTEVLPAIELPTSQPAQAQPSNPAFTG